MKMRKNGMGGEAPKAVVFQHNVWSNRYRHSRRQLSLNMHNYVLEELISVGADSSRLVNHSGKVRSNRRR